MVNQQFKENYPFQPNRITKSKDRRFNTGISSGEGSRKRESSKQRADRMYQQSKQREDKIALKRKELLEEEDKLKKMQFSSAFTTNLSTQRMPIGMTS